MMMLFLEVFNGNSMIFPKMAGYGLKQENIIIIVGLRRLENLNSMRNMIRFSIPAWTGQWTPNPRVTGL